MVLLLVQYTRDFPTEADFRLERYLIIKKSITQSEVRALVYQLPGSAMWPRVIIICGTESYYRHET